jgi:hypothetical protein
MNKRVRRCRPRTEEPVLSFTDPRIGFILSKEEVNKTKGDSTLRVRFGKINLDTIGAGALLGVTRDDEVIFLPDGQASEEELTNPDIFCIEVGSGGFSESNFDHQGEDDCSVSLKVLVLLDLFEASKKYPILIELVKNNYPFIERLVAKGRWSKLPIIDERLFFWECLVEEYIDPLCLRGPDLFSKILSANRISYEEIFPTVSDIVGGIILKEEPVEAFHRGIEFLRWVENLFVIRRWDPRIAMMTQEELLEIRGFSFDQLPGPLKIAMEELKKRMTKKYGTPRNNPLYLWGPLPVEGTKWQPYMDVKQK